jgi:hypothetical protein
MDHTTPSDGPRPNARKSQGLFATLPNELLLPIIKHLPVRDICRLRGQNRHMRKLIDTNKHFLVQDVIKQHHDRINAEHKLLTDLSGCDVIDVLLRYLSYYGILGPCVSRKTKAVAAALRGSWDRSNTQTHRTFSTAALLYHFSLSQRARNLEVRHRQLAQVWDMLAFQAFTTSPQSPLDALRAKLKATTPCADRATYPEMPSVIHTTRDLTFRGMHDEISGDYGSQNTIFHELLGLPLLDPDNSLAFCSHKFETFLLLKRIASGPSTLLQRAGVLEDIHIW